MLPIEHVSASVRIAATPCGAHCSVCGCIKRERSSSRTNSLALGAATCSKHALSLLDRCRLFQSRECFRRNIVCEDFDEFPSLFAYTRTTSPQSGHVIVLMDTG